MSDSQVLARFAAQFDARDIPDSVLQKAQFEVLDTLGIALAASGRPFGDAYSNALTSLEDGGSGTVVGRPERLSPAMAALANGMFAHSLDFDDTHIAAIVHVSGALVPTVLAVAEMTGASGKETLAALVVGYETSIRVGLGANGAFHARGFHPTLLCSVFGCAAAAGRLMGLSDAELTNALGIAGSQAGGLQQFLKDGSGVKRLHAGWAAHAGIIAARLAQSGLTGPERVLEGEFGLYRTHLGTDPPDPTAVISGLGNVWETANISVKPYPCCHLVHAYMDAASFIMTKENFKPHDIMRITCHVPPTVAKLVCEPAEMKTAPKDPYDALFSLPWCVATMLAKGQCRLADFSEAALEDSDVQDLARRVDYRLDTEWSDFPSHFSGWVEIRATDGRKFERRELYNLGCPERPLSTEAITQKFVENALLRVGMKDAEAIRSLVLDLGEARSVASLMQALSLPTSANSARHNGSRT